MSVVVETTLGDITIDLFIKERPRACLNFLKLCKIKYYNYNLFHTISRNFIAQTGDPTGSRNGGESIFGVLEGPLKRYFEAEKQPRIKHTNMGLVSFVGNEDGMIGSQFFITVGTELTYLDEQHCVFGQVVEGLDVLDLLNEAICDGDNRPYKDIRITHTVILDDPLPDPDKLRVPDRSPSPSAERLQGGRIAPDEEVDETAGKSMEEVVELQAEREAKARATILEMVGDIPDAEMAPPENVLFVCKLNPVTTDDDLEIIFSRFGKIKSCEVIRDKKSGDSLQYAFVEFEDQKACEDAYFKMDNVLIDDRRIHVDFSQSVAKVKWHGKGRGVTMYDDKGKKTSDIHKDIGSGKYTKQSNDKYMSRTSDKSYKGRNYDYRPRRKEYDARYHKNYGKHNRDYRVNYYDHWHDGSTYHSSRKYSEKYNAALRYDKYHDKHRYYSDLGNRYQTKAKSNHKYYYSDSSNSSDDKVYKKKKKYEKSNRRDYESSESSSNEKSVKKKRKKKRRHTDTESFSSSSEDDKKTLKEKKKRSK